MPKRKKSSKPRLPQKSNPPKESKPTNLVEGRHQITRHSYSGPLPPPSYLEGYERVLPGCADRIVVMAENQARHRQEQEKRLIAIHESETKRGQWLAFSLTVLCISLAVPLYLYIDNVFVGGAFLSAGLLFILGRAFGKIIQYLLDSTMMRGFQGRKEDNQ